MSSISKKRFAQNVVRLRRGEHAEIQAVALRQTLRIVGRAPPGNEQGTCRHHRYGDDECGGEPAAH